MHFERVAMSCSCMTLIDNLDENIFLVKIEKKPFKWLHREHVFKQFKPTVMDNDSKTLRERESVCVCVCVRGLSQSHPSFLFHDLSSDL